MAPYVRATMIKNLPPRLAQGGYIKIGKKGETRTSKAGTEYKRPEKLDHFVITTMIRGSDDNFARNEEAHTKFGDKPKELSIRLLFDDISLNFNSRYSCYTGKTLWCTGDGEQATRALPNGGTEQVSCTCERADPGYQGKDRCKINGVLAMMLDGVGSIGNVFKFRTTSFNTVTGITTSLQLIHDISGGILAGLPLFLTVSPKTAMSPDGTSQTIYVVGIEYRGSPEDLMKAGYDRKVLTTQHNERMQHVGQLVRALLEGPKVGGFDEERTIQFLL